MLRHTDERVTRKHYIKPRSIETRAAMRLLSEAFSKVGIVKLLPKRLKNRKTLVQRVGCSEDRVHVNVCDRRSNRTHTDRVKLEFRPPERWPSG